VQVLAIDWSGDAHLARSRMWLAEAAEPGRLLRLEAGRDRAAMTAHLLATQGNAVIGLDFGFSFPSWFLKQLSVRSARDLWAQAATHGESWLAECQPPFWGRRGYPRPVAHRPMFRRTEIAVPRLAGIGPKSMFQIGGAGAVGTGSIRGMPLLHQLSERGARVWPFVAGGWPLVLEIYPRLLTGPVRKSAATARAELLSSRYPRLDADHARVATGSEDAFDAAVSALVMIEHLADLQSLPDELDDELRLEGRIWHPAWRSDQL
jgi:hypothetical protein